MFKVEVIKPKKSITLNFRDYKSESGRFMLEISDNKGRSSCISFQNIGSNITSSLLSRWVNFHLQQDLKLLAGMGSSYEIMHKGMNNEWKFRNNVKYFGLHDLIHKSGDIFKVLIDDSIGMRNVVAILNAMGYNVETQFDTELKRMIEIKLTKEEFV